jgi:hypothetical protein
MNQSETTSNSSKSSLFHDVVRRVVLEFLHIYSISILGGFVFVVVITITFAITNNIHVSLSASSLTTFVLMLWSEVRDHRKDESNAQ